MTPFLSQKSSSPFLSLWMPVGAQASNLTFPLPESAKRSARAAPNKLLERVLRIDVLPVEDRCPPCLGQSRPLQPCPLSRPQRREHDLMGKLGPKSAENADLQLTSAVPKSAHWPDFQSAPSMVFNAFCALSGSTLPTALKVIPILLMMLPRLEESRHLPSY